MTFDQIHIPPDADEATVWAAEREFDLRYRRMERARKGLKGTIEDVTKAMKAFSTALSGDLSVPAPPEPKVNKPAATEIRS